jgi:hypothetical protein
VGFAAVSAGAAGCFGISTIAADTANGLVREDRRGADGGGAATEDSAAASGAAVPADTAAGIGAGRFSAGSALTAGGFVCRDDRIRVDIDVLQCADGAAVGLYPRAAIAST